MSDVIKIPPSRVTLVAEPTAEEREANRWEQVVSQLAAAFARTKTAHHEAGHALCEHLNGLTIARTNIQHDEAAEQWGVTYSSGCADDPSAELVALHAGEVAAAILQEKRAEADSRPSCDYQKACKLAEQTWPDDPERQAKEHERARANARAVLLKHWDAVEAVAGGLLQNEELCGDRVHWLLRKHDVPFAGGVAPEEENVDEFDDKGADETGGFSEGGSQEVDRPGTERGSRKEDE